MQAGLDHLISQVARSVGVAHEAIRHNRRAGGSSPVRSTSGSSRSTEGGVRAMHDPRHVFLNASEVMASLQLRRRSA